MQGEDIDRAAFLRLKTKAIFNRLERLIKELDSDKLHSMDEYSISATQESLVELKSNFSVAHTSLEELDFESIASDLPSHFDAALINLRASLQREIGKRSTSQHCSTFRMNSSEAQSIVVNANSSRLPLLTLPKFCGAYTEWTNFYSMFTSIIDKDSDLTNIDKLQHLCSCLSGAALDTVRSLEISNDNYKTALELLQKRFDNKRLIFQAHVREIFGLSKVDSNVGMLRKLTDKVTSHIRALQSLASNEKIADCIIVQMILQKLDKTTQAKWEETSSISELPSRDQLTAFLERRCRMLENVEHAVQAQTGQALRHSKNDNHPSMQFIVKKLALCLNCLKAGHQMRDCKSGSCRTCQSKHHTLLHFNRSTASLTDSQADASSVATIRSTTAVILVKNRAEIFVSCRALLDSGSQLHFVTTRFANQLQLFKTKASATVSGIGDANFPTEGYSLDLVLMSRISDFSTSITALVVKTITDNQPGCSVSTNEWNVPSNIPLADPGFNLPQRIDLLIGAGLFFDLLCVGQIRLGSGLPILQKTRLGWVLSGGGQQTPNLSSFVVRQKSSSGLIPSTRLDYLVRRFWEIEHIFEPISKASQEDLDCEAHFQGNYFRLPSGEYSVRLPIKRSMDLLEDSYLQARQRFQGLERKFARNPDLKAEYSRFIKEYLDLNHISLVSNEVVQQCKYFLPHHCVIKDDSSTTKLRVVFDGSATTTSDFRIYKLDTVTYGTKPAAFLAIRAMHQLAVDESATYPIGAEAVLRDFYVDDLITGGDSMAEVRNIKLQTTSLLTRGNFKLRKWCSNSPEILRDIPDLDKEKFLKFDDGSDITKALGLLWDPHKDKLLFSFVPQREFGKNFKRSALSTLARCYDLLGLMGPTLTKAKILLQRMWRDKLEWDESLPQSLKLLEKSMHFARQALKLMGLVYTRSTKDNNIQVHLLCSKARASPLKTVTIPKLELCAATLLAQLMDSSTVLSWLREEPSRFNVFVANRVSTIHQLTEGMQWHYVPTAMHPADILSKGATPRELLGSKLWMHGPPFLLEAEDNWPRMCSPQPKLPEIRQRVLLSANNHIDISLSFKYINSFGTMQRIFGYASKFINIKKSPRSSQLKAEDIHQGTQLLIRIVQRAQLWPEYTVLQANKCVPNSSSIASLSPFLDDFGIIRVGGRLKNTMLSFSSRHPCILPKDHPLTYAIITYFHRKHHHAGPQALLAFIRMQFWPIGGVLQKCIICLKSRPRLVEHIMANLPKERIQASRPFIVTGVDYCGPFYYKPEVRNKSPQKCYVSVFICFATKAVWMELVRDLSTGAFIDALKRFIATRGIPRCIWSDNATNFVGAKNELKELRDLVLSEKHRSKLHNFCLSNGFDWRFIPPRSPHFGGGGLKSISLFSSNAQNGLRLKPIFKSMMSCA
ncbi:uncharacterized protein LOC129235611 [Anastrepha obliqua]|uniref:uncharacterized protein LOC129235611 n=1 Tax=Anastrepha obliqua TaxID=95512 RepID=UPI00240A1438|nr:uncharacterized protein LOC129235611 [Anastrepha obliqua]